jgi:hypothetical protein
MAPAKAAYAATGINFHAAVTFLCYFLLVAAKESN